MQEKQSHHLRKLKEKVKTPEGVPRLFDLVKVKDEKLKLAFFATLGNTVVANDLDQVNPQVTLFVFLSCLQLLCALFIWFSNSSKVVSSSVFMELL